MKQRIGILGLGYVGLTLAAALVRKGFEVHGVDSQPAVLDAVRRGRTHVFEPGVADVLATSTGESFFVHSTLPGRLDVAVICVSTPITAEGRDPDLGNVRAAAEQIAHRCDADTLVVVRSTVPVGTTRRVVLPPLLAAWGRACLVMAPERTIQGQALRELEQLPQVVGGIDDDSLAAGLALFADLTPCTVPVSSVEAAELVKLSNNCHTDLIYSFGNEIAMVAERYGLDPLEVIAAANLDYPRPDLSRPGFVGGGCLSKDPYLLLASGSAAPLPRLVAAARGLNEYLPVHVAERLVDLIRQECAAASRPRLAVLGWAYKGWPPTDDLRGSPVVDMMPVFRRAGFTVLGHDPMVGEAAIRQLGGEPISLDKAFSDADAVLIATDHPDYRDMSLGVVLAEGCAKVIYDAWRILDETAITNAGIRYASIGYQPGRGHGQPAGALSAVGA